MLDNENAARHLAGDVRGEFRIELGPDWVV
jgi:hypothetical protein